MSIEGNVLAVRRQTNKLNALIHVLINRKEMNELYIILRTINIVHHCCREALILFNSTGKLIP